MEKQDVLNLCTIEGNTIYLPGIQLERPMYLQVAKSLELIGGKWNRKIKGFVFPDNPTELLEQLKNGSQRNIKKEIQFFETPDELADRLVRYAFSLPIPIGRVLEPSAGQGAIIKSIHRYDPDIEVYYCEINDINLKILENYEYLIIESGRDFLELNEPEEYAIIIANPPFAKNQDIDHIYKMYECLEPNGRIVTIASTHWEHSSNKKETEFRDWLSYKNAKIIPLDAGTFKESGTNVKANIIVINKTN